MPIFPPPLLRNYRHTVSAVSWGDGTYRPCLYNNGSSWLAADPRIIWYWATSYPVDASQSGDGIEISQRFPYLENFSYTPYDTRGGQPSTYVKDSQVAPDGDSALDTFTELSFGVGPGETRFVFRVCMFEGGRCGIAVVKNGAVVLDKQMDLPPKAICPLDPGGIQLNGDAVTFRVYSVSGEPVYLTALYALPNCVRVRAADWLIPQYLQGQMTGAVGNFVTEEGHVSPISHQASDGSEVAVSWEAKHSDYNGYATFTGVIDRTPFPLGVDIHMADCGLATIPTISFPCPKLPIPGGDTMIVPCVKVWNDYYYRTETVKYDCILGILCKVKGVSISPFPPLSQGIDGRGGVEPFSSWSTDVTVDGVHADWDDEAWEYFLATHPDEYIDFYGAKQTLYGSCGFQLHIYQFEDSFQPIRSWDLRSFEWGQRLVLRTISGNTALHSEYDGVGMSGGERIEIKLSKQYAFDSFQNESDEDDNPNFTGGDGVSWQEHLRAWSEFLMIDSIYLVQPGITPLFTPGPPALTPQVVLDPVRYRRWKT